MNLKELKQLEELTVKQIELIYSVPPTLLGFRPVWYVRLYWQIRFKIRRLFKWH